MTDELPADDSREQAFLTSAGESYRRVEEALRNLTYADKEGDVYFSLTTVRYEMGKGEEDASRTFRPFIDIQNKLEELVSKGKARLILGDLGPDHSAKLRLYRYI